jgi:hypothetical protein
MDAHRPGVPMIRSPFAKTMPSGPPLPPYGDIEKTIRSQVELSIALSFSRE